MKLFKIIRILVLNTFSFTSFGAEAEVTEPWQSLCSVTLVGYEKPSRDPFAELEPPDQPFHIELFTKKSPENCNSIEQASCFSLSFCTEEERYKERIMSNKTVYEGPNIYARNEYAAFCIFDLLETYKTIIPFPLEDLEEVLISEERKVANYVKALRNYLTLKTMVKALRERLEEFKKIERTGTVDLHNSIEDLTVKHTFKSNEREISKKTLSRLEENGMSRPNPFLVVFLRECYIQKKALRRKETPPCTTFIQALIERQLLSHQNIAPLFSTDPCSFFL